MRTYFISLTVSLLLLSSLFLSLLYFLYYIFILYITRACQVISDSFRLALRNQIALQNLSFSSMSHRSVFMERLLRRAIPIELDNFSGQFLIAVHKFIYFYYGRSRQIRKSRVRCGTTRFLRLKGRASLARRVVRLLLFSLLYCMVLQWLISTMVEFSPAYSTDRGFESLC